MSDILVYNYGTPELTDDQVNIVYGYEVIIHRGQVIIHGGKLIPQCGRVIITYIIHIPMIHDIPIIDADHLTTTLRFVDINT